MQHDTNRQNQGRSVFKRSLGQAFIGEYSGQQATPAGTMTSIGVSLTGLDLPKDLLDLTHTIMNWEWTRKHGLTLAVNAMAILPVVGIIKSTKLANWLLDAGSDGAKASKYAGLTLAQIKRHAGEYANAVNSNKGVRWRQLGIDSETQQAAIKEYAIANNLIENANLVTRVGKYADFSKVAGVIRDANGNSVRRVYLPPRLRKASDADQFKYLNDKYFNGTQPDGFIWHHYQYNGGMELVPRGLHELFGHWGGRSPGRWGWPRH